MEKCIYCEAMDESIDILCQKLQDERRKRRELYQTIRLLKQEIARNLEQEFVQQTSLPDLSSVCQDDSYLDSEDFFTEREN